MKAARLATLFLFVIACTAISAAQGYRITNWSEEIQFRGDATFDVKESLQVQFDEERHGIYRTIPIVDDNGRGVAREIYLSHISVSDGQGNNYTTKIDWSHNQCKIRVGDADTMVPAGTVKQYDISYHVENA